MIERSQQPYIKREIPVIDDGMFPSLLHDIQNDPDYLRRVFHDSNESNHALMVRIVIEANRQSKGDISNQASFVRGAEFVLASLIRQLNIEQVQALFNIETEQIIQVRPTEDYAIDQLPDAAA